MTPALRIHELDVSYGAVTVLRKVALTVPRGQVTCLLGANGAGKTSTLRAISNVLVKARGTIELDGESILGLAPEKIVHRGVAHVPDGRGTLSHLTVRENLRLGAYPRRDSEIEADMERMLGHFPRLKERFRQQAGTLSGGEQQMLAISRALMLRPRLLLLDEPSFGLAPKVVTEIFEILKAVNAGGAISILLVEQNAALALELSDRACLLETGQVVLEGPADQLRGEDRIRRAYLGM
jgi:branched-chain amino acid transport system ATP-binding protein